MMRKAEVYLHEKKTGILTEIKKNRKYRFEYLAEYNGPPVSVTIPTIRSAWDFEEFPPFFEGLLPEGANLEVLLRTEKIDREDLYSILMAVGNDTVGAVTVKEAGDEEMSDLL